MIYQCSQSSKSCLAKFTLILVTDYFPTMATASSLLHSYLLPQTTSLYSGTCFGLVLYNTCFSEQNKHRPLWSFKTLNDLLNYLVAEINRQLALTEHDIRILQPFATTDVPAQLSAKIHNHMKTQRMKKMRMPRAQTGDSPQELMHAWMWVKNSKEKLMQPRLGSVTRWPASSKHALE